MEQTMNAYNVIAVVTLALVIFILLVMIGAVTV